MGIATNDISVSELQAKIIEQEKPSTKFNLNEIFSERNFSYLNPFPLFISYFNAVPHSIEEESIDCKKANKWFSETYKTEIKEFHFTRRYFDRNKKAELDDIFYIIYEGLLVNFDTNCSHVRFLFRKTDIGDVESVIAGM